MIVSDGKTLDFAPQALGEITPSLASGYFYGNQGIDLSGKFATYSHLYKTQPSVATVVDKISNSAARLSVRVWDITNDDGKVEDLASPFAKLLASPNNRMSPYSFWRWTFATLDIYGESFWYKQRDSFGNVFNLVPMHPSRVAVKRDHDGNLTYIFTLGVASAGILTVPDTEVVAFMRYNPESLMRGMSRLEPLRTTLLNEDASRRATASWWKRGARPSVILKHPGSLSQPAQDRLRATFDARHSGADNMAGTAVLEEGMEAQVIQLSAEEMQYIESRKLNLQEVCMVYDVPPPVIHILDHATYSNITEQMRSMYRDTMAPRLEEIESVIDSQLRGEFYESGERIVKFALDEVLRGDFETRAQAVIGLVTNGVMKPSEARPLFDLPALGGSSDELYANGGLVPLGTAPTPAQAPSNGPSAAADGSDDSQEGPDASAASKGILELKYSADQERDDAGRFAGSGGSAVAQASEATLHLDNARELQNQLQQAIKDGNHELAHELIQRTREAMSNARNLQQSAALQLGVGGQMKSADNPKADPTVRSIMGRLSRVKASKTDLRAKLIDEHQKAIGQIFEKQRAAVKADKALDPKDWNQELGDALHALAVASSDSIGKQVFSSLKTDTSPATVYSDEPIADRLRDNAYGSAASINKTTAAQVKKRLAALSAVSNDDVDPVIDDFFDGPMAARKDSISLTRVAFIAGLAGLLAARLADAATKTWVVNSDNPRPEHAALDGETVGLSDAFSNGMHYPGEFQAGGADEVANCTCSLEFGMKGN